jgi:hypothetical protein
MLILVVCFTCEQQGGMKLLRTKVIEIMDLLERFGRVISISRFGIQMIRIDSGDVQGVALGDGMREPIFFCNSARANEIMRFEDGSNELEFIAWNYRIHVCLTCCACVSLRSAFAIRSLHIGAMIEVAFYID